MPKSCARKRNGCSSASGFPSRVQRSSKSRKGVFGSVGFNSAKRARAAGKKVYWDATNEQATETASGNTYLGKTVKAAGDDDTTVRVRLEQ